MVGKSEARFEVISTISNNISLGNNVFNLNNPEIQPSVTVYDADINIPKLVPANFNHTVNIFDSDIHFMGRDFHIISAKMQDNKFN